MNRMVLVVVLAGAMLGACALAQAGLLSSVKPVVFSPGESNTAINRVRFSFDSVDDSRVIIRVYDLSGAMVRRSLDRESDTIMYWDGSDAEGLRVRSGVYLYQVETNDRIINGAVVVAQ